MSGIRRREFIVLSSAARLRAAKAFVMQQLRRLCGTFIKRVRENVDGPPNPHMDRGAAIRTAVAVIPGHSRSGRAPPSSRAPAVEHSR
jgi:hypothetical protein